MSESIPFLYAVVEHKLSFVKLFDGISFGVASGRHKVDLNINHLANVDTRGRFLCGKDGWQLECLSGQIWLDGKRLQKNQITKLKENSEIRLCDKMGDVQLSVAFVFSDSDRHLASWRICDKTECQAFAEDLSDMDDGDCRLIDGRLIFCFGQDLIYQEPWESRPEAETPLSPEGESPAIQVDIEKVEVGHAFKKTLLKDVHVTMKAGRMYLLLGGAGAGKTTFMEAVTGMISSDTRVNYCGRDLLKDESARGRLCLAPQFPEQHYRMDDTVFKTLDDAVKLTGPAEIADDRRRRADKVHQVLQMMDIDSVSKSRCSSLSGGQKKKLTIAMEYIAEPQIMFLDEPDSGVDGSMVKKIMADLRRIADEGMILCMITHTPDRVRDLFDKVIVIGKSSEGCGRLCFFGSVEETLAYFECKELEEVVNKISGEEHAAAVDAYVKKFKDMGVKAHV